MRLPFEEPSYRDKLSLILLDSAAALKAWETRRANGEGKKIKPNVAPKPKTDDDRPFDPKEVSAIGQKLKAYDADLVASFGDKSDGYSFSTDAKVKQHVNKTLAGPIAAQFDFETIKAASIGLKHGTTGGNDLQAEAKHLTAEIVSSWASTSGDHDPSSVAMQYNAVKEFGLTKHKLNDDWEDVRPSQVGNPQASPGTAQHQKSIDAANTVGRATLRTMYDNTQAEFKKLGITHLTLYRGTKLTSDKIKDGRATVRTQPMSSWTTDFSVARNFYKSAMLAVRVPVEKVVGSYLTGYGCRSEREVVILGDEYRAYATKTYPESAESFAAKVNVPKSSGSSYQDQPSSGLTPGQKAAATKKANAEKAKTDAAWDTYVQKSKTMGLSDDDPDMPFEDTDTSDYEWDDEVEPEVVDIDDDWREADWPKVNGDAGSGIPPGLIDERGNPVGLAYREKLALLLKGDPDRSEAAKKAWDTRGRKGPQDPKPRVRKKASSAPGPVAMRPATAADAARLKALKLPPAWTNVHLSEDPNAPLQAYGFDVKGRKQSRYSAEHTAGAAAEKFERVKEFNDALPNIRKTIAGDLKRGADPEDREAASVLYLIDKTAFRPGSDRETLGDKQAYGATTLEAKHVKIDGNKVSFSFTGKKGVAIAKTVEDATLARMLSPRVKKGGRLFSATDGQVRNYLKAKAGDFKTKDFRTWHGTATALRAMRGMPKPKTPSAYKKAQREVAKIVAEHLGNTPAVSLKSYIDPSTWSKWQTK